VTSSTGATLNYTVTESTTSGGNWLTVTPASGTTGESLTVSVAGVVPGTYTGQYQDYRHESIGSACAGQPAYDSGNLLHQ
jgi:hypothetical protein